MDVAGVDLPGSIEGTGSGEAGDAGAGRGSVGFGADSGSLVVVAGAGSLGADTPVAGVAVGAAPSVGVTGAAG